VTAERRSLEDCMIDNVYHAAFLRDPGGHNVEAVCHRPA
jgi:hypothetical protein